MSHSIYDHRQGLPRMASAAVLALCILPVVLAESPTNTAIVPVPKLEDDSYDWYARHEAVLKIKDQVNPEIVMIGDSITHFWAGPPEAHIQSGPLAWKELFGQRQVLNLGFGWDRTQNVLWRLDHGEFDGLHPQHVVINIGTNNFSSTSHARANTPAEVAEGIRAICDRIRAKSPESRIIVMGVLPRGAKADDPFRSKILELNRLLADFGKASGIAVLDIGQQFLLPTGELPRDLMDDFCHPTEKGYAIWASALKPLLQDSADLLPAPPATVHGQASAPDRPVKKLIEYGWDVPYPDQVRREIRSMEEKPFDGIIFRLREWNHAFDPRPWNEADLKPQLDDLAAIEWKTFTDNFLCLYAANNWKMDWFNDEQWKGITANLQLTARAAKIGRCVGVVFDPEPYGDNPWAYAESQGRSFAEVEAQVRRRGAQFMAALQTEMPEVRVLTFFHQSLFADLLARPDLQDRQLQLSKQHWGLLSAFWNGALEAASPGARVIDGYEMAYYFTAREPFYQAYHRMKQSSLTLVPPELRTKHAVNFQAGMALYMDQVLGLRQPVEQYLSTYLTPEQRASWFEHNVYYALTTSDEYVWCYSERMNWWQNQIPEGAEAAIRSAKKKIADGQPLGFDMADILAAGQKKMNEAAEAGKATPK